MQVEILCTISWENWWSWTWASCESGVIFGQYEPRKNSTDNFQFSHKNKSFNENYWWVRDETCGRVERYDLTIMYLVYSLHIRTQKVLNCVCLLPSSD